MKKNSRAVLAICLVIAFVILVAFVLRSCRPQVQIEQMPSRIMLPLVFKNWNLKLVAMRGVAASGNGGTEAVRAVGASWYLNWWYAPTPGMPDSAEFIPMINAPVDPMPDSIAGSEYLMGANEPNVAAQVNICPADYVATWHEIESRWDDRQLVSPGVGWAGNINCVAPSGEMHYSISGADWLTDFRTFYSRQYGYYPEWDVLSFHCYPPPEAPCEDFCAATEIFIGLADEWDIPEVWISEWDAGKGGSQNVQRLRDAMAYWLTTPKVTRVAYYQDWRFSAETGNSPLVDANGQITEYGIAYRDAR